MSNLTVASKILQYLKHLPLWLIACIATSGWLFLLTPLGMYIPTREIKDWLPFITTIFTLLTAFLSVSRGIDYCRSRKALNILKKTFHVTPIPELCHFEVIKQSDGSVITDFRCVFIIKNCANIQIFLADAYIKSKMERITNLISDGIIPVGTTSQVRISIILRGEQSRKKDFKTKLYIVDSDRNKQNIPVNYKNIELSKTQKSVSEIEIPSLKTDPIEKEIASVLQLELSLYRKYGRRAGKLGSIYINIDGRILPANVVNVLHNNSYKSQNIHDNPENVRVNSENLDALLILYNRLATKDEKERFIQFLIDRIDQKKGYLSVSYFIVYILFKLGYLREALNKAKSALPQDETQVYGFSNVLLLLGKLLYYRHQDFSTEILDYIELFISELSEHSFSVGEQIKAIRVFRLLESRPQISSIIQLDDANHT